MRTSMGSSVWSIFPDDLRARWQNVPEDVRHRIEEVRLRSGQPVQLIGMGLDTHLCADGGTTNTVSDAVCADKDMIARVMHLATQASLYAVEEELRRGYVTVAGGHRIGVAGRVVLSDAGTIKSVRTISSINIRIAREWPGAADAVRGHLTQQSTGRLLSTLILSPPGCGKTTLLRDLARQCSEGSLTAPLRRCKVTIVDERSEIAGSVDGVPQFGLGTTTDVLDGCPKADGMLMAIRSLSPDVLVTDEIGRQADADAILEALNAGVTVMATAHANSLEEWRKRPFMETLFGTSSFQRFVLLSRRRGPGTVERIYDADGKPLAALPDT